jgi:hypothetical protein
LPEGPKQPQAGTDLVSPRRAPLPFSPDGPSVRRPARVTFPSLPGPARPPPVTTKGVSSMGKGNHSQKNDKKNKKPKQDKTKTVVKK